MPSLPPGLLLFISIFSRQKSELFLKKGDVIHSVLPCFIGLFIPALELIFLPRSLLQKCVLQQLIFCTSRYAINSSVKVIQAVVSLLSSLFFPTIVAWKVGPSPTVLRGGQRCEIEEEVSGETMSETKPLHSRNVREIRWCPTKEPVKPLGCRVTLPKTRMEPEDKPKDQERCDQDHLEGQAQRQMLVTSSSSSNRSGTDPAVNRSDTDHSQ